MSSIVQYLMRVNLYAVRPLSLGDADPLEANFPVGLPSTRFPMCRVGDEPALALEAQVLAGGFIAGCRVVREALQLLVQDLVGALEAWWARNLSPLEEVVQ